MVSPQFQEPENVLLLVKRLILLELIVHVCALDASLDRSFGESVREKRLGGVELHLYEFSPHLSEQSRASNKGRKCWKQFSSQTYENQRTELMMVEQEPVLLDLVFKSETAAV